MTNGKNLTAAFRIGALTLGAMVALTMAGIPAAAQADMTSPQPAQAVGDKPQLTFPPTSDCTFLGGAAGQACEKRRAGNVEEYQRVLNGDIKLDPGMASSSGGPYTPLSNSDGLSNSGGSGSGGSSSGELGGLGEMAPIGPSENVAPTESHSFNPNSIGNAWSGTPYSNGTGTHSY